MFYTVSVTKQTKKQTHKEKTNTKTTINIAVFFFIAEGGILIYSSQLNMTVQTRAICCFFPPRSSRRYKSNRE